MKRTDIIETVLNNDFADTAGHVEAPCGHWTYSPGPFGEGVYAVRTDNYGFKHLAEFEGWVEADEHRSEVEDAEAAWYLGEDEVEDTEAPADMDFSDLS